MPGREAGPSPLVDLERERRHGELVRALIAAGLATAVHDISDGGLVVALAEMCMASGLGAVVDMLPPGSPHVALFAEDQARYVLACKPEDVARILQTAEQREVPVAPLGRVKGDALRIGKAMHVGVDTLRAKHEEWFKGYMRE